ncbi:MAG: glycosyltransferase family 2 protein [Planctomycetota bacterium]|jgi:GT2 family glycosyltransferase
MTCDVSIIIVNWNTCEALRDCVASIHSQTKDIGFEVIVIDNASKDGSVHMLKAEFPDVILVQNSENRGFAAANNQGIVLANGRYILLLNSDTIICDNAIVKTVVYADQHLKAAVIGCQVWEDDHRIQMTCFRFPSLLNIILRNSGLAKLFKCNRFLGREKMLWWPRDSEREIDVISGMFMLVRSEAIDQVGLMDESYFLYFEETDWCRRFWKQGWKVVFWPGAKILHVHGGSFSTRQQAPKMFVQFRKSLLIYFEKHYGPLQGFVARNLLFVDANIRSFIWIVRMTLKKLRGKDVSAEMENVQNYWRLLKFCVLGIEPETEV